MPDDDFGLCPSCDQDIVDDARDYADGDAVGCPFCSAKLIAWVEGEWVLFEQVETEEGAC